MKTCLLAFLVSIAFVADGRIFQRRHLLQPLFPRSLSQEPAQPSQPSLKSSESEPKPNKKGNSAEPNVNANEEEFEVKKPFSPSYRRRKLCGGSPKTKVIAIKFVSPKVKGKDSNPDGGLAKLKSRDSVEQKPNKRDSAEPNFNANEGDLRNELEEALDSYFADLESRGSGRKPNPNVLVRDPVEPKFKGRNSNPDGGLANFKSHNTMPKKHLKCKGGGLECNTSQSG